MFQAYRDDIIVISKRSGIRLIVNTDCSPKIRDTCLVLTRHYVAQNQPINLFTVRRTGALYLLFGEE